jgi:integrase/recombinase XerD
LEDQVSLSKQAKTLSKGQVEAVLGYLAKTRWPARNRLIFLLSAKAGLRAKEIAPLTWWMTNDSQGEVGWSLCLLDSASKGKSGRMIPLSEEVREALIEYRNEVNSIAGPYVISTERARQTSPQAIVNMFQR